MFVYEPHAYQEAVEKLIDGCKVHTISAFAGRRGGKTVVFAKKIVEWLDRGRTKCCGGLPKVNFDDDGDPYLTCPICGQTVTKADVTDVDILVVAPTYTDLNDVHISLFKKMLPIELWDRYWNEQKKTLTIPLEMKGKSILKANRVFFRSADKPEKIGRGMSYDVIWLDETRFMRSLKLLVDSLRPTLVDRDGFLYTSTTTNGKDEAWRLFYRTADYKVEPQNPLDIKPQKPIAKKKKGVEPDMALVTWRTIDNPHVPQSVVIKDKKRMNEWYWRQEYFATVEAGIGVVYPVFSEKTHVCSPRQFHSGNRLFVGIDVGWNHPTAMVFIIRGDDGVFYVVDEYYERQKTAGEIAVAYDDILTRLKKYNKDGERWEPVFTVIDPASRQKRQSAGGRSMFEQLTENGMDLIIGDNDVMAGINLVTSLLMKDIDGKRGIMVFDTCKNTINEFNLYRWKVDGEGNRQDIVDKRYDDAMDAIRYVFMARPEGVPNLKRTPNGWEDPIDGVPLDKEEEWVEV